jgi:hypothetical protein
MSVRKGISERAVDWLEKIGYLQHVQADMKSEVMKALVELEELGEIPPSLRIKRYTPSDDLNKQSLAHVLEFLNYHGLKKTIVCLQNEVNCRIESLDSGHDSSLIAQKIQGLD